MSADRGVEFLKIWSGEWGSCRFILFSVSCLLLFPFRFLLWRMSV